MQSDEEKIGEKCRTGKYTRRTLRREEQRGISGEAVGRRRGRRGLGFYYDVLIHSIRVSSKKK